MRHINTVLGTIEASQLGRTRMHEHVILGLPGPNDDFSYPFDREVALQSAVTELSLLSSKWGISTIVDATPSRMVPHHELLAAVAEATGMNVIASAGFYIQGFPDRFTPMDVDAIAEMMEIDITEGIAGSGIKAGAIKLGSGIDRITEAEERAFRAAARVHKSTGVPIITHTDHGNLGQEQLDILIGEGANPSQVVIGHSCCSSDLNYHMGIMKRGAFLGFDRVGLEHFQPDEIRAAALVGLISQGYSNQIIVSQDHVIVLVGILPGLPPDAQRPLTHLHDKFIPHLRRSGVSDKTIDEILIDNPRRIFQG